MNQEVAQDVQVEAPIVSDQDTPPAPQDGESQTPPADPPPDPNAEVKRNLSSVQARINRLTFEKNQEAREKAALAAQLASIQQSLAEQRVRSSEPRIEQFQDYTEYTRAVSKWEGEQAAQRILEAHARANAPDPQVVAQHQQAYQYQQQVAAAKSSVVAEGAKKYADFAQTIAGAQIDPGHNPAVLQAVLTSPHAPDLTYYLAKNPQEAEELLYADPMTVARKIAGIESKLSTKRATNAPPPPHEVGGQGGNKAHKEEWEMSPKEWQDYMDKKQRGK